MGGSGDNALYEAKTQAIEDKKQAARDQLNYLFGIGDGGAARGVSKVPFTSTVPHMPGGTTTALPQVEPEQGSGGGYAGPPLTDEVFDQSGYEAQQQRAAADAEANNPNRGARDTLYQTVRNNAYGAGKRRLDEANQDATRKLKFELLAKGLSGGSEDVDQNALRGRTYNQGIVDLGGKADSAKADFRQGDETTRLNLLQSIDSGMDQGTALSSAVSQMGVNNDKAAASAIGTDIGNLFDTGALLYNQSEYAKGKQAGQTDWWNNYSPNSRGKTGNTARYGQITNVG